jgi:cytochrome d ubiquinol oxidase subunit II
MFTYEFLQNYWWFILSLLGGLLVFLLFVQGGNALIFIVGKNDEDRRIIINSTGRKWEFTFTTLVTFGGAFFASFPLFYSTSFGGAYWVWFLILLTFVLQGVSYEFQNKVGNILGTKTFQAFLTFNGVMGPFLLGAAVATFFTGSEFIVNKDAIGIAHSPVISSWGNAWHGVEALANPINVLFALAVTFLAACLGSLYMINNIEDQKLKDNIRKTFPIFVGLFLLTFLSSLTMILLSEGFAVASDGEVFMEKYKYLHNLIQMPLVAVIFLVGVVFVLYGFVKTIFVKTYNKGIWWAGAGTVFTVMALLMLAGYNSTSFYPSTLNLQSSLTLQNACSSEFTLKAMTIVSFVIPFVLAYIVYAWKSIDIKSITRKEIETTDYKY